MALISRLREVFLGPEPSEPPVARSSLSMPYAHLSAIDSRIAGSDLFQAQHPILQITQRLPGCGIEHAVQMLIMHAMREYSPTLDAAIKNRRALEGDAYAVSEDRGLADALNEWMERVPVGYLGGVATLRGLNVYADLMGDNADEYGLSAGEMLTDERGRELTRLVVPNARTLSIRDDDRDGIQELYQSQRTGSGAGIRRRIDDQPLVQVLSFSYNAESPWPTPLAWSLVRSTEVVLRMYESVNNAWWRFGDPSILFGIEYSDKEQMPETISVQSETGTVEVPAALFMMKQSIEAVMKARRNGSVGDAYVYTDAGGKIRNEVLQGIDASMMRFFREHQSVFDGYIIAHSRTPVWMYPAQLMTGDGLGGQKSQNEALLASVDARKRNSEKARLMREVIDTYLLLSGDARFVGKYDLDFDHVSIIDEKVIQDARKAEADANAAVIENAVQAWDEEGNRRFSGEAEQALIEAGIYQG